MLARNHHYGILRSVKVPLRSDKTCDSVNSNKHESFLYFSTVCYVLVICRVFCLFVCFWLGMLGNSIVLCLCVYLQSVPNSPGKKVVQLNGGFQLTIFFVLGSIKIQNHQFLL